MHLGLSMPGSPKIATVALICSCSAHCVRLVSRADLLFKLRMVATELRGGAFYIKHGTSRVIRGLSCSRHRDALPLTTQPPSVRVCSHLLFVYCLHWYSLFPATVRYIVLKTTQKTLHTGPIRVALVVFYLEPASCLIVSRSALRNCTLTHPPTNRV